MQKKKFIIFTASLLVLILLFVSFNYFYLQKIRFYEPVSIYFPGINSSEGKSIEVFSITPLERKIKLQYSEPDSCWRENYGYSKAVEIIIPDTLTKKINSVHITIGGKKNDILFTDLKFVRSSKCKHSYILPDHIRSEDSLIKLLRALLCLPVGKMFLKLLLYFTLLLFVVFFTIKWKKTKSLLQLFSIFLEKKLKQKNTSLQKLISWLKITGISVFIACTLFFGYLLIVFCVANYVSAVLFILLSCALLWFIIKMIVNIFKVSPAYIKRTKSIIIIFLFVWLCIETFLRMEGINMSYNERNDSYYSSGFSAKLEHREQNPHLFVHPEYYTGSINRKEFSCKITCNNEGLRDIDHPVKKEENEYRIICLGNSFTESIGTSQDSTWPKLLEYRLKSTTKNKLTVFNAGKAGSDPFFEYILLKERLLKYEPDLVLLTLGSSDFDFFTFRGGFERFTTEGFQFRKGPQWEKLYAVSYIFRLYINDCLHYKRFLLPEDYKKDSIKAIKDIDQCTQQFYQLSLVNKFKLVIVFYDDEDNRYTFLMNKLKQEKMIPVIDLFEYNKNIEKISRLNNSKYYWPIDGHYNAKGYDLLARGVLWNLKEMGILDSVLIK